MNWLNFAICALQFYHPRVYYSIKNCEPTLNTPFSCAFLIQTADLIQNRSQIRIYDAFIPLPHLKSGKLSMISSHAHFQCKLRFEPTVSLYSRFKFELQFLVCDLPSRHYFITKF